LFASVESPVMEAFTGALETLRGLEASIVPLEQGLDFAAEQRLAGDIIGFEAYHAFGTRVERDRDMMDPAVLARVLAGKAVGVPRYEAALEHRARL